MLAAPELFAVANSRFREIAPRAQLTCLGRSAPPLPLRPVGASQLQGQVPGRATDGEKCAVLVAVGELRKNGRVSVSQGSGSSSSEPAEAAPRKKKNQEEERVPKGPSLVDDLRLLATGQRGRLV